MKVGTVPGIRAVFRRPLAGFELQADLALPGQGVTILFGASGSGKTTLLRCFAGLEPEARGTLSVNGEVWQDDAAGRFLPAHRRAVGYVFQEAALFPHLDVEANLRFGLKRIPPGDRRIAFDQAVDLLGLRHLLTRAPARLSGGEQQRVGIGRALLASPRLLLMDEPLAALDVPMRREIMPYLERLHDELEIPVLYVTHSPDELARLGDYLVLLDHGQVRAQGPVQDVLAQIDHLSVFVDDPGVVLQTTVVAHEPEDGVTRLEFAGQSLWVAQRRQPIGSRLRCRVLPTDVSLTLTRAEDTSILNILEAKVTGIDDTQEPSRVWVRLVVGETPLLAQISRRSCRSLGLAAGQSVFAQIKAMALLE